MAILLSGTQSWPWADKWQIIFYFFTNFDTVDGESIYLSRGTYTHFKASTWRFQIFCHFAWKTCIQVLHSFDVVLNGCKAQNQNIKIMYDEQRENYWPCQRRNPESKSFTYNFRAFWLLQFFFAILHKGCLIVSKKLKL